MYSNLAITVDHLLPWNITTRNEWADSSDFLGTLAFSNGPKNQVRKSQIFISTYTCTKVTKWELSNEHVQSAQEMFRKRLWSHAYTCFRKSHFRKRTFSPWFRTIYHVIFIHQQKKNCRISLTAEIHVKLKFRYKDS